MVRSESVIINDYVFLVGWTSDWWTLWIYFKMNFCTVEQVHESALLAWQLQCLLTSQ